MPDSVAADAESRQTRRVTALPEPPRLRAVDDTDRDPLEREGLALVYAALEHTLARAALDRLTVAIKYAALNRDAFARASPSNTRAVQSLKANTEERAHGL